MTSKLESTSSCPIVTDRPFYMVVLVGYSVAGLTDCRCGPQWADVGCLGNHVLLQVRATIVADQAVARGETVSFFSGRSTERYNRYLVML